MGEAFRRPGGGQAGIKVKAYSGAADLPTRARNGDIAVITAVQISDVGCGLNVPEGAAEGMVWVLTGDLASLEIPIGKPPIGFRDVYKRQGKPTPGEGTVTCKVWELPEADAQIYWPGKTGGTT